MLFVVGVEEVTMVFVVTESRVVSSDAFDEDENVSGVAVRAPVRLVVVPTEGPVLLFLPHTWPANTKPSEHVMEIF